MITYNHEKYIAQAIESVISQQTNFLFELVIGEDCSTDSTRDIVLHYRDKYPDKIRTLLPSENLGPNVNFINTYNTCSGRFVAMLEGDDYWTDSLKLQRQTDFLLQHEEFVGCFHDVSILFADRRAESSLVEFGNSKFLSSNVITLSDYLNSPWLIHTCSLVFRREVLVLPDFFVEFKIGDGPVFTILLDKGPMFLHGERMAMYRLSNPGSFINNTKEFDSIIVDADYLTLMFWLVNNGSKNCDIFFDYSKRRGDITKEKIRLYQKRKEARMKRFAALHKLINGANLVLKRFKKL